MTTSVSYTVFIVCTGAPIEKILGKFERLLKQIVVRMTRRRTLDEILNSPTADVKMDTAIQGENAERRYPCRHE